MIADPLYAHRTPPGDAEVAVRVMDPEWASLRESGDSLARIG